MREQKQRDKEEEKRRQEAAELRFNIPSLPSLRKSNHSLVEITLLLCNLTRCDPIRYCYFSPISCLKRTNITIHFFCHVQKAMQNMDVLFTHLPLEKQYLPSFFFRMAMNPMNLCNDRWSLFDDHFFFFSFTLMK